MFCLHSHYTVDALKTGTVFKETNKHLSFLHNILQLSRLILTANYI